MSRPFRFLLRGTLLVAIVTFAAGCNLLSGLDQFDVPLEDEITVPGADAAGDAAARVDLDALGSLDMSHSSTFDASPFQAAKAQSIVLTSLDLSVGEPAGEDLSFLGTVVFYIEAPGLPAVEVARQDRFPDGAGSVAFTTSRVDLTVYLSGEEATLTMELLDGTHPDATTKLTVRGVFAVDLGAI